MWTKAILKSFCEQHGLKKDGEEARSADVLRHCLISLSRSLFLC